MGTLKKKLQTLLRFHRDESGQDMTEYALISFWMLGSLGLTQTFFPHFLPDAINSYRVYVLSFYVILGLPLP